MAKASKAGRSSTGPAASSAGSRASARRSSEKPPGGKLDASDAVTGGGAAARGTVARTGVARGRGQPAPKIPGEKSVRATNKTVPVGRERVKPEARHATAPAAVDRRSEVAGSAETIRDKPRAARGAGTASRRGG